MDNTLYEINKHKFNILSLANKLINTYEINQEISINNEIKKGTEFLLSLLNIKNSSMMNQMAMNNMNFFNPMMNPNFVNNNNQFQQMIQQQLMQMQQMLLQPPMNQQMENIQKIEDKITVKFRKDRAEPIPVKCSLNNSISDIIKKYRKYSLDNEPEEKFIFNAKALSPSLTVAEAGLTNNSNIFVVETNGLRGG